VKLSVLTKWVALRVDAEQIHLDLHLTPPSGPAAHIYSVCSLRDLPLTRTDCNDLIRFFTQLKEEL